MEDWLAYRNMVNEDKNKVRIKIAADSLIRQFVSDIGQSFRAIIAEPQKFLDKQLDETSKLIEKKQKDIKDSHERGHWYDDYGFEADCTSDDEFLVEKSTKAQSFLKKATKIVPSEVKHFLENGLKELPDCASINT